MKLKFNTLLIAKSDTLVVAVSGGVDSMVLLHQLIKLKDELALSLYVVHMNHHKRSSSNDDEAFVKEISSQSGLDMKSFDFNKTSTENFQMEARNQRYHQFYQYAKSVGATKIVLAHHADDQLETILMRLVRGSSFSGYSGIKELTKYKDIELIRPLLHESKENILKYASEYQIRFREDESNLTDDYTRNRFRHNVVPALKEENPKTLEKVFQFSDYIASAYDLIQSHSESFLVHFAQKKDFQLSIPISKLLTESKIVQKDVIIKCINYVSQNLTELSEKNIELILDIAKAQKPNTKKKISSNVFVYRQYNLLVIQSIEDELISFDEVLNDFGTIVLPNNDTITISQKPCINGGKSIDLWYNNLSSLFPITVRNRKDRDVLNYRFGRKKLKDELIYKKIPMKIRNSLPLVLDSNHQILFIPEIYTIDVLEHQVHLYITYLKG